MLAVNYVVSMKKILVSLVAVFFALTTVSVAQAQTPAASRNAGITGMWLGSGTGFENGALKKTDMRFTITQVDGVTFTGTKSWRSPGGTWSEPEGLQGAIYKSGEFHAVDEDGYMVGRLISPTKIRYTYLEAGSDSAAIVYNLVKASRSSIR
jgi:hypothetical protein